jgi:hypothetical protein
MKGAALLGVGALCWSGTMALAQTITVSAPAAGTNWVQGSVHTLQWTGSGLPAGQTVSIVLRLNGNRLGDIALNVPAAQGQYQWTVGTYLGGQAAPGSGYRIRVRTPDLPADSAPFAIAQPLSLPRLPDAGLVRAGSQGAVLTLTGERMPESEVLRWAPDLVVCTSNTARLHADSTLVAKVRNRGRRSGAGILHLDIQGSSFQSEFAVPSLNRNEVFTAKRNLGNKVLTIPTGNHYTLTVEMTQPAPADDLGPSLPEAYPENNTKTGLFYLTSDPIPPTPGFVCADGTTIQ